ncbi:response regulator [Deinococcus sp. PEB2-63]
MPLPLRLLFIDDQQADLILLEDLLLESVSDASFVGYTSGLDALQYLSVTSLLPHLIVLDWHLIGLSGLELLRALQQSSRTQSIPVVVRSGSVDPQHRATALAAGATEFLVKPLGYLDQQAQLVDLCAHWNHLRSAAVMPARPTKTCR